MMLRSLMARAVRSMSFFVSTPPEVATAHIYVGIIPFVMIQLLCLVVLWFVPALATALPHALYGG